jgi:transcriptional regulator with PAS, ATPase and Fis domain
MQGIIVDVTERKHASDFMHIQLDLDSVLGSAASTQDSFDTLLELALRIKPVDSGAFYLVDEKSGDMNLVSHKGLSEKIVCSITHYEKNSVLTRLVMTGQNVYKHHSELSAITSGENLQYEGLHATAVIPVQHQGDVIAALILSSHDEYEIPDNSRYDLEVIAAQVGELISHMRSETDMQRNLENLRSLVHDIPESLMVLDDNGNILYSNPTAVAEIAKNGEELVGKNLSDFVASNINIEEICRATIKGDVLKTKLDIRLSEDKTGSYESLLSRSTRNGKSCVIILLHPAY